MYLQKDNSQRFQVCGNPSFGCWTYTVVHDAPSVTKIYEEVYGEELVMNKKINERRAREHALLEEICQEQGVPV